MVDLMDGTITFESQKGTGTTFTVDIPLKKAEHAKPSDEPVVSEPYRYKYENGDYTLNLESSDILELIEDVSQELESLLKEKNVKIRIKAPEQIEKIKFDSMQIKRVLVNLLGNAITYAYKDTDIEVSVLKENEVIKVQIGSHSPYINPSLLKNLFEKYVTHAAKYNKIGVGLGLYLSKQIVNAHNGEIGAISFEENRNIFEFTIPLNL